MSRVSSVLLGGVVVAIAALSAGCSVQASVTAKSKTRFVEDNVQQSADADWAGEDIIIDAQGVGIAVNGGLDVVSDPSATRVTANARMLAMAVAEEKANADQSIIEAKATYRIVKEGNAWKVTCGHGGTHGSSNGGESGCEKLIVTIPTGTAAQMLKVTALSGNGSVNINLANAQIASLGVNAKGDVDARVATTKGANISIVAEQADDVVCRVPADFAADSIELVADADKRKVEFADVTLDASGKATRGEQGTGAASIKLTSKEFAGSTGIVTLSSF